MKTTTTRHDDGRQPAEIACVPIYEAGELRFGARCRLATRDDRLPVDLARDQGRGFMLAHVEVSRAAGGMRLIDFTLRPAPLGVHVLTPRRRYWRLSKRWPFLQRVDVYTRGPLSPAEIAAAPKVNAPAPYVSPPNGQYDVVLTWRRRRPRRRRTWRRHVRRWIRRVARWRECRRIARFLGKAPGLDLAHSRGCRRQTADRPRSGERSHET